MSKEYRAKVFKSGNSLALRIPKELGLKEGSTMVLREEQSGFRAEPQEQPKRKFDIDAIWGIAAEMEFEPLKPEEREFEERPSTIAARKKSEGK